VSAGVSLSHPEGVNVAGYLHGELGLGEIARQMISALERDGIPVATIPYPEGTLSRQEYPFAPGAGTTQHYDVNVVCVNADNIQAFARYVGPNFFRNRYTVGVWFWETSVFPPAMHGGFDVVDEIWVASPYVEAAISAETDLPVVTFPVPLSVAEPRPRSRAELGLPEAFVFLFSFDFLSVVERKNPIGLIRAFNEAFGEGDDATLVVKSINGDRRPEELARVRAASSGDANVLVLDGYLEAADRDALMASCDCYVSLHRSEGFGLTMAEAMAYGRPVIATGYSGNLTFMDGENSYLVPYKTAAIPQGCEPYPPGAEWAEPDLSVAAELMRRVYERREEALERGRRARETVAERLSPERTTAFLQQRLKEIRGAGTLSNRARSAPLFAGPRSAVERARVHLAKGPAAGFGPSTEGRSPSAVVRRALLRALWPYLVDQYTLNSALVESIAAAQQAKAGPARLTAPGGAFRTIGPDGRLAIGFADDGDSIRSPSSFGELVTEPEGVVQERLREYVRLFGGREPVLDLRCDTGALLREAREAGLACAGVDIASEMVERCRSLGLSADRANPREALAVCADGSLGAVFARGVLEYLSPTELSDLFASVRRTLAPSGLLVGEMPNPHAPFRLELSGDDSARARPVFPEVAVALCSLHGFASAYVLFPHGRGDLDEDLLTRPVYAIVATAASAPSFTTP
jgi:glycosyltransferase involved in cell wall biosynthesis/SAM-dependent methyltransferase